MQPTLFALLIAENARKIKRNQKTNKPLQALQENSFLSLNDKHDHTGA